MTKSLPLPPRFFKCPELSEREETYLVGKAKESAKALVDATRNNEGPVRWEEAGMHRGVQMYKGEARYPESVVGETITYGCGATTIQSTLDEVADFFDLSSDAKMADFIEFNADMMDGQLLYVIQDPTVLNDSRYNTRNNRSGSSKMLNANQVTVKWFATEMPSKLMKNRDFLTVECQSTFMDVSGRRGWVRSYHSIKLPCCPELGSYGLVRGSFYHTGHVFVESERPGFLDVIYSAQVNLKGSMKVPAALFMTLQKKRLSSIADLQKMITRRRLGAQRFLGDLELVPKSQRTRCNLCSSKFGLITRKARCRKCGEVVCASACSTEWEVSIPGQGVRKVRVCSKCAQNTDPSVFEDLPASEQYSESNSAHDEEPPLMSVRAPGYQYDQFMTKDPTSSPSARNARRQNSRGRSSYGSDEHSQVRGGQRRQPSGRRAPYSNSFEDSYSQDDNYQDPDPEYPRTVEMPGEYANLSLDSDRYTNDPAENEDYPPSSRRKRGDSKYDPRNPDVYDHESYGASPPPHFRDEEQKRALQRQQRALQKRQHQQRLMQRQQQQQALLRRQQQQQAAEPDNFRDELDESFGSSEFSTSDRGSTSSAGPSFLTSSLLAQHTKQMGKPGPVTRNERYAAQRAVQEERAKRKEPVVRLPPPNFPTDRPLTRLEQIQQEQWEMQEAFFREQADAVPPFEFEQEPVEIAPSFVRRRRSGSSEGSAKRRGPKLPSFFRSPHSSAHSQGHGAPTAESPAIFSSGYKAQAPNNSGQRTLSLTDDEERERLEESINGMAINFGSLLRPEDLRLTEENLSLDSSGQEHSAMGDSDTPHPGKAGASAAKNRADASKTTIVKLYQRILDLTNKQHELEAQPESDPKERLAVARELEALYHKLNAEVEI